MPQLKQLSCCLQWSDTGAPFQEHGTVYGDGVVESFVIVPNRPCTFTIHLKSHGFIHGGLAMIVFIDGNYQCNRNRVNLQPVNKDQPSEKTEIDFLLRQKEKSQGDGIYMGRQWRFDNHNIIADPDEGYKDAHFDDLGTIEVIVLRCVALYHEDADYDGFSSGEDSDIFGERPPQEGAGTIIATNGNNEIVANNTVVEPAAEEDVGGLFGLFDGPSDGYEPYRNRGGRWVFVPHQMSDDFTHSTFSGTSQHPSERPQFRIPNYDPPYPRASRQEPGHYPQNLHQPERRVHWDVEPESGPSDQPHQYHFRGGTQYHGTHNHHPTPQRPPSHERIRSYSQTSTGPPYPPQQVQLPSQMNPPVQMNLPLQITPQPSISQAQQTNSVQRPNPEFYMPNRSSQSQQLYQGLHPEQGYYPSPMGNGYVSEHTNQTQPEAYPELFARESVTDQYIPQIYLTWPTESSLPHQNDTEATAPGVEPTASHIPVLDANSQQFGNQLHPFLWPNNQPWGLLPHQNVLSAPQHMYGRPSHFAPWSRPPPMTVPYPQHLHAPHVNTRSVPHVNSHINPNGNYPQASLSIPPTETISPGNTMFDQPGQAPGMNIDGNGWPNHNATAPFQNINNTGNSSWNAQENAEVGKTQNWGAVKQNEANDTANNWDSNAVSGQGNNNDNAWQSNNNNENNYESTNNNDNWQSNNDNNDTWQANNDNANGTDSWDNAAAKQTSNTWANDANNTQANAAGDTWGAGNNDTNDNLETQIGGLVNATLANIERDLYGPHGPYYSYRALAIDEPKPDAEEEPRFDVPQSIAIKRGSSKQVQPGPGYQYYKKCLKPEYLDTLEHPYARFVFKYRTKEQLQEEIGIDIDVEPSSDQAVTELQNLDKQTLVEMLMRAKGALGGKIPSPTLTPVNTNGAEPKAVALPAPNFPYLRYSLPPLRPFNPNVKPNTLNQLKGASELQNTGNNTSGNTVNDSANNSWANNDTNNQNWEGAQHHENNNNWNIDNNNNITNTNTQNWGGASGWDSARDGDRMPPMSNQPEQQQQRPSVQFSMQSQNNGQASNGGNASQPAGEPTMNATDPQQQNNPNNEEHSVPQPPPPPPPPPAPPADNWDAADAANSQAGWV